MYARGTQNKSSNFQSGFLLLIKYKLPKFAELYKAKLGHVCFLLCDGISRLFGLVGHFTVHIHVFGVVSHLCEINEIVINY